MGVGSKFKYYFSREKFDPLILVLYHKKSLFFTEYLNRAILLQIAMYMAVMQDDDYNRATEIAARVREIHPPPD